MLKLWSQPIKDLNLNHHKFNTLAANPIGTHPAKCSRMPEPASNVQARNLYKNKKWIG